jgi:hypothetical protein
VIHRVPDERIITPFMLRRFIEEARLEGGNGQHYAIMQLSDGRYVDHNPASPALPPHQAVFARDMLAMLNREMNMGGVWVIVYTHPVPPEQIVLMHWEYARFGFLWIDADGDPQFTVEWTKGEGDERDFADVMRSGRESWANRCMTAWQTWKHHMVDVLAPGEGQTIKRAQGQQAAQH